MGLKMTVRHGKLTRLSERCSGKLMQGLVFLLTKILHFKACRHVQQHLEHAMCLSFDLVQVQG